MADFTAPTGIDALKAISAGKAAGIRATPLGWRPPYVTDPDYVPADRRAEILANIWTPGALAVIMVGLRTYSRRKNLAMEDWIMLPATVATIGFAVEVTLAVLKGGMGRHGWDITYEEIKFGIKMRYFNMFCYIISITLIKLSIIAFLFRIAGPAPSKRTIRFLRFTLAFQIVMAVVSLCVYILQCLPLEANLSLDLRFHPDTHCKNFKFVYYFFSCTHAISDFLVLIAPIGMTIRLRMSLKRKLGVMVMFAVGGVACLCSILRMGFISRYTESFDISWDSIEVALCGMWEVHLAIISASLPALRGLWRRNKPTSPKANSREITWGLGSKNRAVPPNGSVTGLVDYELELALAGKDEEAAAV